MKAVPGMDFGCVDGQHEQLLAFELLEKFSSPEIAGELFAQRTIEAATDGNGTEEVELFGADVVGHVGFQIADQRAFLRDGGLVSVAFEEVLRLAFLAQRKQQQL